MSDREDFLARWSRRKAKAADDNAKPEPPAAEAAKPSEQGDTLTQTATGPAPPAPEFDVSSLPPIELIGAETDISAFLKAGVPAALRHAALRRVWVADPAIRDFIGPNENFWDVAGPDGVPGFGALDPGTDVNKLVGEIFRDFKPAPDAPPNPPAPPELPVRSADNQSCDSTADLPAANESATEGAPQVATVPEEKNLLHREDNIAPQHDDTADESVAVPVRRHGSAMPQ